MIVISTLPSLTATWHNTTYPTISPSQPHLSVAGKAVLITGGGRGIGARTAHSFASAGASFITITGRTLQTLESTKAALTSEFPNTTILTAVGDVTSAAAMEAAFSALSAANGGKGVDICIHNAGYLPDAKSVVEAKTEDWWSGFETNVLGSFIVARAFLKHKNASSTADVPVLVGVGSAVTMLSPPPKDSSGYAVSKMAQQRFFEALAEEEKGVRVMQVHPGVIVTDMGRKGAEQGTKLPVDDISLPADFMVWAVSPEAAFLQGRLIWCNWDVEELKAKKEKIIAEPAFLALGVGGWPFSPE